MLQPLVLVVLLVCALLSAQGVATAGTARLPGAATAALSAAPTAPSSVAGSPAVWFPLRGSTVIGCTFNSPNAPCNGTYHPYWALDLEAPFDAPIYPAGAGTAHILSNDAACGPDLPGRAVSVDHGDGTTSRYFHMNSILIQDGQEVDLNTVIGTVGNSGYVEPCDGFYHLHYEKVDATGNINPGELNACHGAELVTYPAAFDIATWEGFPAYEYTATNDGADCSAPQEVVEGSFVSPPDGSVYRIAGGAPVYVSSWEAVGGEQAVIAMTDEAFAELAPQPADGTFLVGFATGTVYRTAGGAPLAVVDCAVYAVDCASIPAITVDQTAVDNAGGESPYDHLLAVPRDGTFLTGIPSGQPWKVRDGVLRRVPAPGVGSVDMEDAALAGLPTRRPDVVVGDVSVTEGDNGRKTISVPVTMAAIASRNVLVRLQTVDGTATAPDDYVADRMTVRLAQGERSGTATVRVVGDTTAEDLERFFVEITSAKHAIVIDDRGRCRIRDND